METIFFFLKENKLERDRERENMSTHDDFGHIERDLGSMILACFNVIWILKFYCKSDEPKVKNCSFSF